MSPNPIQFDTAHLRWSIILDRKDHHTTATVIGTPSTTTQVSSGAPIPTPAAKFTMTESNQDTLFERIRSEITRRDGPIKKGDPSD